MKKSTIIYWSSIGICIFLVCAINMIFDFSIYTLLYCLFALFIVVLPCILFVTILEYLPAKLFAPERKRFKTFKFENKFYEKIGVKKWKDNIPVIKNVNGGFDKAQMLDPKSAEYLHIFLTENCKAEVGHGFSIIWGYLAVIICLYLLPSTFILSAWLPVAIISGFVHFLSFSIQRYIRPRLLKLYSITKAKEDALKTKKQTEQFDGDTETATQN